MKKVYIRKESQIPFTKKGYFEVQKEREELLVQRPKAVSNLREAREMGDLSENGYYKEARARLSLLDGRVRHLDRLIRLGVIAKPSKGNKVEIGSLVTITDGKNEQKYSIVGGYESDPSKGTISHRSPIGNALMGKKEKDKVVVTTPAGTVKYTMLKVAQAK